MPIRIVDFNNMFSFRGGGVRTYHLRKLDFYAERADAEYTLMIPSDRDGLEWRGRSRIRHLRAPRMPGAPAYRHRIDPRGIRRVLKEVRPHLVEVGGPYLDPWLVRVAARDLNVCLVGFWHTHYPEAYFHFYGRRVSVLAGRVLRRLGWWYARKTYGSFDAVLAASDCVVDSLVLQGIHKVGECPLGVDTERFSPSHRDASLRRLLGAEELPLVFFPHRLLREKGVFELAEAIPQILRRKAVVFVFAGAGPGELAVRNLASRHAGIHYVGYIESPDEMARYYASADLVLALSPFETFGLSIVEAMASGTPLVGPSGGAGHGWIRRAGSGGVAEYGNVESLVGAVLDLLGRPDLRELGLNGRRFVKEHLQWDRTFTRQLKIYRRLLAHRSGESTIPEWPLRWVPGDTREDWSPATP